MRKDSAYLSDLGRDTESLSLLIIRRFVSGYDYSAHKDAAIAQRDIAASTIFCRECGCKTHPG